MKDYISIININLKKIKNTYVDLNCSKYIFNRLLTKDPSETSSLEYK